MAPGEARGRREPMKITRVNFRAHHAAQEPRQDAFWRRFRPPADDEGPQERFIHPRLGRLLSRAREEGWIRGAAYMVADALLLCMREDRDGVFACWPSRRYLADVASVDLHTVRNHLARVCAVLGIEIRRRRGSNIYTLRPCGENLQRPSGGPPSGALVGHPVALNMGHPVAHLDGPSRGPHEQEDKEQKRGSSFFVPPPLKQVAGCARASSRPVGAGLRGCVPAARTLSAVGCASGTTANDNCSAAARLTARIFSVPELARICEAAGAASREALQLRIEADRFATPMPGTWLAAIEDAIRLNHARPFDRAMQSLRDLGVARPDAARAEEIEALLAAVAETNNPGPAETPAQGETGIA